MDSLMDDVAAVLTEVAQEAILPVYQRIEADPHEVTPGEWVTTADLAAEVVLVPRLRALVPDAVCLAEETSKSDPRLLERLDHAGRVWVVDPLDGTSNFAQGRQPFRSMVALVSDGRTVASWIHDPVSGSTARAERGAGAWLDGQRVRTSAGVPDRGQVRGSVLRRFLPPDVRSLVDVRQQQLGEEVPASMCAGLDYVAVGRGVQDFVLYWRTLPWDHIPGALFLTEAGGVARRPTGDDYAPRTHAASGLLAATNEDLWHLVNETLLSSRA